MQFASEIVGFPNAAQLDLKEIGTAIEIGDAEDEITFRRSFGPFFKLKTDPDVDVIVAMATADRLDGLLCPALKFAKRRATVEPDFDRHRLSNQPERALQLFKLSSVAEIRDSEIRKTSHAMKEG